mmetsp:Transcript_42927/g.121375  ORF Transcript_42927/g.121375 Transcript_42927/m.121375 type:complete len:676 (+) Transcript_42927:114-2141(+)
MDGGAAEAAPAAEKEPEAGEEDSLAQLPPGSFGAGGWAPGGKGKYPRLSPQQAVQARADFRNLLLKRYHTVLRAWKAFDTDGNGRLSIFEFMRACQDLGVNHGALKFGARQLWDALDIDRSGYISIEEIDFDLAKMLMTLAATIWVRCGTLRRAWAEVFNRKDYSFRIPKDEFVRACEELGFPGDAEEAFEALRSDTATVGLSEKEFHMLGLWFSEDTSMPQGPLHDFAEQERRARNKDTRDVAHRAPSAKELRDNAGQARKLFKQLLINSYCNFLRAWRQGLDHDHNGVLDYSEFKRACTDIGYPGPRRVLWNELDGNGNGSVSLMEIDEATGKMVENLFVAANHRFGTWAMAWDELFDTRHDDRVNLQAFVDGCRLLGYKGNASKLFDMLDLDRSRYLTLEETEWIEAATRGEELPVPGPSPEEIGDIVVTGNFKAPTMSRRRLVKHSMRDQRLMQKRFDARARGEIPGSSTFAGSIDYGSPVRSSSSRNMAMTFSPTTCGGTPKSVASAGYKTWGGPSSDRFMPFEATLQPQRAATASGLPQAGVAKQPHVSRDPVGLRPAPGVPDHVSKLSREMELKPPKLDLSKPMSPQAPGKGGWPLHPDRLSDPVWGGSGPRARGTRPSTQPLSGVVALPSAQQDPVVQAALLRCTMSAPDLHAASLSRWRQVAGDFG